jgi:hypothetical protein
VDPVTYEETVPLLFRCKSLATSAELLIFPCAIRWAIAASKGALNAIGDKIATTFQK